MQNYKNIASRMQLFISYVLNKVAPIHNPNTKVVNFLSMTFFAEQKSEF